MTARAAGEDLSALAAPTPEIPIPDASFSFRPSGPALPANSVVPSGTGGRIENAAALHRAGRLDEAIRSYNAVLAERPDHVPAWVNLGVALKARNRLEAAAACYRRATALDPNNAAIWSNLGNVLRLI